MMGTAMLNLELLKTLVCVVDEGSFTRAAERVHRTQSTVSQQIRKLEELVGHDLLLRDRTGTHISLTEQGAVLLPYARRLLAMAWQAQEALDSEIPMEPLRIGVPEDFDARRMADLLADFSRDRPGVRLETFSGMSFDLHHKLAVGDLDLALVQREPNAGACLASWPERLVWVTGQGVEPQEDPVALVVFPQGCIYRQRAVRLLDAAQRRWRVVFSSHSLTGIQAAVASGLGVTVLPTRAVLPEHKLCVGLPELPDTQLAILSSGAPLNASQTALVEHLRATLRP
jgi:DNA-binding transcriptional LysR family regulator